MACRRSTRHNRSLLLRATIVGLSIALTAGLSACSNSPSKPVAAAHNAPPTSTAPSTSTTNAATTTTTTAPPTTTTTTAPPATTTSTSPPPPPSTAAATGCTPLSDEGTCYEPGEYCRDSDHGVTGRAGDGETITCDNNDGWRWEPS